MTRLSGCLDELSAGQRRVLVLRAGVGSARPHSRPAVARRLDITVKRVRRLERSGLRHARALAHADACGGTASSPTVATAGAVALPGGGSGGSGGSGSSADAPDVGHDANGGVPESEGEDQGAVRGESSSHFPPRSAADVAKAGGVAIALAVLLFVLAGLAGFVTPNLRGRLRSN